MTLLAVLVFATVLAVVSAGRPWVPEPRPAKRWLAMHNSFVENTLNNNGAIQVLFYGDSITQGWAGEEGTKIFAEYYAPLGTANYGVNGDRAEHMHWRILNGEVTTKLDPKLCVVLIGTNNLGVNDDVSTAVGVIYSVKELRERMHNTKFLVLGLLPRNNEKWTNRTSNVNDVLKPLDNGKSIRFLDLKEHFYKGEGEEGDLIKELYLSDMVHLSEAGYRKWAEVMDPLFKMLNDSN